MATVKYTIVGGVAPFTAKLIPSSLPSNIHYSTGTYQFDNVSNGICVLNIVDSNGCEFEQELNVNPSITTTTTTLPPGDSIVVGNTDDINLIFDTDGTNRDSRYEGYPVATQATLYVWLKTYDGKPLAAQKTINYTINSTVSGSTSTFKFLGVSDEIHTEVIQSNAGPNNLIAGQIILKPDFIETYFKYSYYIDTAKPDFKIELNAVVEWLLIDIPLVDTNKIYGVTYIDRDNVIMNF